MIPPPTLICDFPGCESEVKLEHRRSLAPASPERLREYATNIGWEC